MVDNQSAGAKKRRSAGIEESMRMGGFIAEGRAAGQFGHALREFCRSREIETGPHTEYTVTKHDRSQPSPYGRDDPRWWPHMSEERRHQQRRLRAQLDRICISLSTQSTPDRGDAYEGPDPTPDEGFRVEPPEGGN